MSDLICNITLEPALTVNIELNAIGNYTLPIASASTLGGVKKGSRVSIDENGVISADTQADEQVKFNSDDPEPGYIINKFVAGTGITAAEGTEADENKLKITNSDTGSSAVSAHNDAYNHSNIHSPGSDNQDLSGIFGNMQATFKSPASTGIFHAFGFYEAPTQHAALNEGALTQTLGSANNAYQSHAFIVAQQAGVTAGGTGLVSIVISGTSITSAGVRTASDTEIIVTDITSLTANKYIESTKMWLGQITFTLTNTSRTTYSVNFNYGYVSANHFYERNVTIKQFECTGRAGASDSGFNIQLLKHSNTGWTYSASAFIPGGTVLLSMNTDFNTEKNIVSGKRFHYHRKGLSIAINGATTPTLIAPNEGVVVRITTTANNSVDTMDMRIQYI
jgi:hypothetical protein